MQKSLKKKKTPYALIPLKPSFYDEFDTHDVHWWWRGTDTLCPGHCSTCVSYCIMTWRHPHLPPNYHRQSVQGSKLNTRIMLIARFNPTPYLSRGFVACQAKGSLLCIELIQRRFSICNKWIYNILKGKLEFKNWFLSHDCSICIVLKHLSQFKLVQHRYSPHQSNFSSINSSKIYYCS